jgi:hypothetical protein
MSHFGVIDPTFALSNRFEAAFWALIGIGMAIAAVRQRGIVRRDCVIAAITFAIFGGSDLVEATTGAWWRPWWLFAWKAVCALVFVVLFARYLHRKKEKH